MPLRPGSSRDIIQGNIREMMQAGHPPKQAIAAALSNAHRHALGGLVNRRFAAGGTPGRRFAAGGLWGSDNNLFAPSGSGGASWTPEQQQTAGTGNGQDLFGSLGGWSADSAGQNVFSTLGGWQNSNDMVMPENMNGPPTDYPPQAAAEPTAAPMGSTTPEMFATPTPTDSTSKYPGFTMPGPAPTAKAYPSTYAAYPTTPGGVTSFAPVAPQWTANTPDPSQAQLDFINKYQGAPGMFFDDYPQYSNPSAPGYTSANDAEMQYAVGGMPITSTTAWTAELNKLAQQSAPSRGPTFYNQSTTAWEPISNLAYADRNTQNNYLASKYGYADANTGVPEFQNIMATLQSGGWNPSQGYAPQTWNNDPNMQYLNDLLRVVAPTNPSAGVALPPAVAAARAAAASGMSPGYDPLARAPTNYQPYVQPVNPGDILSTYDQSLGPQGVPVPSSMQQYMPGYVAPPVESQSPTSGFGRAAGGNVPRTTTSRGSPNEPSDPAIFMPVVR